MTRRPSLLTGPIPEHARTARFPYLPQSITEPAELVAPMRNRRGGRLNEADLMVLHSPRFARGWNELTQVVRNELTLSANLRELEIIGVSMLHQLLLEVRKHAPAFLFIGGTQIQLDAMVNYEAA